MMKLEVSGLSFSYDNKKLFENLDFSIKEGEFVSLLGPSGCGKSTILKLLTGVIQAETGRITVDGQPVTGLSEHFAYMPQNDLLFPWKTILDNVCLYGQIHGSMEEMRREASKNFPAFGWRDMKQNILPPYPAECASAPHFCGQPCVRPTSFFWMSPSALWML